MKLKVSYLLPLLIFSIAGFAKADDGDDTYNGQSTRTEGGYCIECANANPTNFLNK